MSGICGIINFDGAPVELSVLKGMAQAAAHRGPDGVEYWIRDGAGLANLALRITPESLREVQPLERDNLVLIADARIDNRSELIELLGSKGRLADSAPTDADLILASYVQWGANCAERILGDFAFAIWDAKRRHLFAARDPMAMRALYYRADSRGFLFASEAKQILACPGISARIFEPAVYAYLVGNFDNLEWTFYEGIKHLAPGHVLLADAKGLRAWRYWDIDLANELNYRDEHEYADHLFELLSDAVRCRLRSVKPVAISLSGGMDSGSVAAVAGWLHENNSANRLPIVRTYSWAYKELMQCDERHISDSIVSRYDLKATPVDAERSHPLKGYPAHGPDCDSPLIYHYQPLIEDTMALAQAHGAGVAIFGGRGDLMMGVDIFDYFGLLMRGRWPTLWRDLRAHSRRTGIPTLRLLRRYVGRPVKSIFWALAHGALMSHRLGSLLHRGPHLQSLPEWISPDFASRHHRSLSFRDDRQPNSALARRDRYDAVFSTLTMTSTVLSERSAAKLGLNYSDPWSDRRVASFCVAVPQHVLNRAGEQKRLARQAMNGVMPEQTLQQARKVSPAPLWERAVREWARETVLELSANSRAATRGYIDERKLRNYLTGYLDGTKVDERLWLTLTLEMWLRQHWQ